MFARLSLTGTFATPFRITLTGGNRYLFYALGLGVVLGMAIIEIRTSRVQSRLFAAIAGRMTYKVQPGPAPVPYPGSGPYDERLGYSRLSKISQRLEQAGYKVESQARSSTWLRNLAWMGVFPTYPEKSQAGLQVLDAQGQTMFTARYPNRVYPDFDWVPPLVVHSLLYIENREILDPDTPYRNPAVEWDRLFKSVVNQSYSSISGSRSGGGASTLATQIEKIRHSPDGRTPSVGEKFRQMVSASLRAYQQGEDTIGVRKKITCDYLNSLPLTSLPGYGEVHGLGDGLWAWFDADFARVNRLLALSERDSKDPKVVRERALAYRQVLSLLLAVNRPSYYLQRDRRALEARVDSYLRMLAEEGAIGERLRDEALAQRLRFRDRAPEIVPAVFSDRKATDGIRGQLLGMLDVGSNYELDRFDLTVNTQLDRAVSDRCARVLRQLTDRNYAASAGIVGKQMIEGGPAESVIYSFNLYETSEGANLLRVQADNYNQPLNINQGTRLELGSTAKLRTLATYLEVIAALHEQYNGRALPPPEKLESESNLTKWVVEYLTAATDRSLPATLEAAMQREYSAAPWEPFFTGGGLHYFSNFDREHNSNKLTVRQGLRVSSNLVFVRIMRDIVQHYSYRKPGLTPEILWNPQHPLRAEYIARFAEREGIEFVTRFHARYKGKPIDESLKLLAARMRPTPYRLAMAYRSVRPGGNIEGLLDFLESKLPDEALAKTNPEELFRKYSPENFNLGDQGYIARIHPLELWTLRFLNGKPNGTLEEAIAASKSERQEVYRWLLRGRHKHAQDIRIRILLEVDAFAEIHKIWKKHGYPFPSLTPSLATAIGSSGDNPSALAELLGIVQSGGVRYPVVRINRLHFAKGTPMETVMVNRAAEPDRVMPAEVAAVLRQELFGVVAYGTARRAHGSVVLGNGQTMELGGKTGTGDNRMEAFDANGYVIRSKAMSRTAAFAFVIGDRFYGTVIAYVPGPQAAAFNFTSALPVQVFRHMVPVIRPVLDRGFPASPAPPPSLTAKAPAPAPRVVRPVAAVAPAVSLP